MYTTTVEPIPPNLTKRRSLVILCRNYAEVAELADAHDSNSCGFIRVGSTPTFGILYMVQILW